jgi:hypothetical protein
VISISFFRIKMPQAGSMLSAAHVVTTSVGEGFFIFASNET